MDTAVITILLIGLVISAAVCVIIRNLLKSAIALAVTSAILAMIMVLIGAPLAAVFELSVCAGLITVIFVSAISMTRIHSKQEEAELEKQRRKRFQLLPVLLIVLGGTMLFVLWPHINSFIPYAKVNSDLTAQQVIWDKRQVDLLGQIAIILVGVYGVLVFFKEGDTK